MDKQQLILIGGGGHCVSCIDVIEATGKFDICAIVDLKEKMGQRVLNYPVAASDDDLSSLASKCKNFLITIGSIKDPAKRVEMFMQLKKMQLQLPVVISPRAYLSPHASIGEGSIIMHSSLVNAGVSIGKNCIINTGAMIEHDVHIGDHSHISTSCVVNGMCHIGSRVFIGSNSVLAQEVRISDGVVVGAGAVVVKNIDEPGIYVGNPARRAG